METRKNYGGISATSANQARFIKSLGKNGTFEKARIEASAFLLGIAPRHHISDDHPKSWDELKKLYLEVIDHGASIPVFDGGGQTVYTIKAANLAYRAWHDYTHLKLNADFLLSNEKRVAKQHLREAKARGLSRGARWLLWIDSQGQNDYYAVWGQFVENQYAFCKACFDDGLKSVLESGVKF